MIIVYFQGAPTRYCVHEDKMKDQGRKKFIKENVKIKENHQGNLFKLKKASRKFIQIKEINVKFIQIKEIIVKFIQIKKSSTIKTVIKVDYKKLSKVIKLVLILLGQLLFVFKLQKFSVFSLHDGSIFFESFRLFSCFLLEFLFSLPKQKVKDPVKFWWKKVNTWEWSRDEWKTCEGWKDTCLRQSSLAGSCMGSLWACGGRGRGLGWWLADEMLLGISYNSCSSLDDRALPGGWFLLFQRVQATKQSKMLDDNPVASRSRETKREVSLRSSWQVNMECMLIPMPTPCQTMLLPTPIKSHTLLQWVPIFTPVPCDGQFQTTVDLQTQLVAVTQCETFTCLNVIDYSAT